MNLTNKHLKQFKKDGFFVYNNLINSKSCEKVNKIIYKLNKNKKAFSELDLNFPFSKMDKNKKVIAVKNIKQNHLVNKLINLDKILKVGQFLTEQKLKIWYKKFYPKYAFDGDNEVYHQDFFYHKNKGLKSNNYLQCFIAFHDHNLSGGCLRIFKGSHKLGLVKHVNIMTRNGLSKFTIPASVLKKISKKCKLKNLELKKGSCVFFGYSSIHGSSSNASAENQNRMICQMMSLNADHHLSTNQKINNKRSKSEFDILKKMIKTVQKLNKKPTAG